MQIEDNNTDPLTYKKIFDLVDARFTKKNILYEHLYNSYNDFIIDTSRYNDYKVLWI